MFRSVPYVNTVLFLCRALLIEQFSFIKFLVYSLVYYSIFGMSFLFIIIIYLFILSLLLLILLFLLLLLLFMAFGLAVW